MKAILEFDLSDIDDEKRFNKAISSVRYSIALWELYHIRSHFKYYDRPITFDEVVQYIDEVFEEQNININELD